VPTSLHTHTFELASAACAGAESTTRPTAAMVVAALMDSSRRVADMGVMVVVVVMVYLAGTALRTERMIHTDLINPICPTSLMLSLPSVDCVEGQTESVKCDVSHEEDMSILRH
jgi:hypothetical protein